MADAAWNRNTSLYQACGAHGNSPVSPLGKRAGAVYRSLMASGRVYSRIVLNILLDGSLAALAVPVAHWLARPGTDPVPASWWLLLSALSVVLGGIPFRLPTQYWRFAGIGDLVGVAACSISGAVLFTLALVMAHTPLPSKSFPVIFAMTLLLVLGTPRVAYRLTQGNIRFGARTEASEAAPPVQTVLLVGAGEGADLFLRATAKDRRASLRVIGLLALSSRQTGRRIHGQPILGTVDQADEVLERLRTEGQLPGQIVITASELGGERMRMLMDVAEKQGMQLRRAADPTLLTSAAADADSARATLKPVAIEDLLNRPQARLDREGMARLIQGRRVLVTGAGGTIGSELSRQVAAFGPSRLLLLDNGEYALWQIDLELGESFPAVPRQPIVADIRDAGRLHAIMQVEKPELVFHAAALKHVPMVEANPLEGLLTNAVGTRIVADAAAAAGALGMVLISTDKAVNPTSVMGASKRLAEMYCQALDRLAQRHGNGMRCVTVRFGNVLGSTGSVVPLFRRQLERGGPLTVTHPDMRRYFMTVREAVGLVLQATVVGVSAGAASSAVPEGGIFVLDMGEPVKIVDLARQLIRLAGLRPDEDVAIRFTGLRPGEKLYEELFHGKEPPEATIYPGLLMARPRVVEAEMAADAIDILAAACRRGDHAAALAVLAQMVPEFVHQPNDNRTALPQTASS
ncbi:UDP-D-quinovosamine 4-dehydrogenase [Granulibacter bethesdensis]|nr:nucleoside-diphosphate sugar epimerase/dehydratase [Granulibacter bethesdensis]AHJ67151.1 UDP-D-quinovosamine 4-dehydrogenase [Granulibacter bethesdensis]